MRRYVSALAIVLALVLVSAGPALAAEPTHSPSEFLEPLELPAGTACDFGVTLVTTSLSAKTSIWEDADGTVRLLDRGFADGYAESEEGRRFTQHGGYRIEITIHPDGSFVFNGSGNLFAWYFAGDPIVGLSDPGAYAIHGRLTESYAPDGALLAARFFGGRVVDLCDALAPDAN
jgi:hypothetical protein